ncbi:Asp23/Gls24 family envelope stress response protein [Facklamia hominis]|uniref:Stress response regulator gls24 homolog n=1 Tax=Facklamia hominis TaxID=178214 RepID=A0AAJ1Q6A7_9LACT|nr:Asp23/Gls24 family envelope stress response protein [Facklamia hominis]MDK7187539.1 Asp23/Gls24 family envelope stress response protein [Facklamia hominis]
MTEDKLIAGKVTFDDKVIEKIIARVLEETPGVIAAKGNFVSDLAQRFSNSNKEVSTDGINVEVGQEQVAVDLDIIIEYDQDVPEIAEKISQLAYDEIKLATGLDVIEVNVNVADIMSKEEYAKQQAAPKE